MITFSVNVGSGFLGGDLSNLQGLDGDLSKVFKKQLDQSAAAILNRLRTTYLAEQDPLGSPWVPSYAGKKRREAGGTGTLFDTGRLFRSIQLARISDEKERVIGTDVPYGPKHNFGERVIKRTFLDFTPEHEELAINIFKNKVKDLYNVKN